MIKNYDNFVQRVAQAFINVDASEVWTEIKQAFEAKESKTLIQAMNKRLQEYQQHLTKQSIKDVLLQMDELAPDEKDEIAYELLGELMIRMRDAIWEYYWEKQLENLTKNLGLDLIILED